MVKECTCDGVTEIVVGIATGTMNHNQDAFNSGVVLVQRMASINQAELSASAKLDFFSATDVGFGAGDGSVDRQSGKEAEASGTKHSNQRASSLLRLSK